MTNKTVITAGKKYVDIDGLACAVAYAELINGIAVLNDDLNVTVPPSVREWGFYFERKCPLGVEKFVIVDVSDPGHFPDFVEKGKIAEVWDHRSGFEDYWGAVGHIEKVGACATQIFELFKDKGLSAVTANLLYTAIFANTLCFKANVTTERDKRAFEKLKAYISLPDNWVEAYYHEVEAGMLSDFEWALACDVKEFGRNAIAQLELWEAQKIIDRGDFNDTVEKVLGKYNHWLLTMPSISEGRNYLFTNSLRAKEQLEKAVGAVFSGNAGATNKLYMRKELMLFVNF